MDYKWIELDNNILCVFKNSKILLYEPLINSYKYIIPYFHSGKYMNVYIKGKEYKLHRIIGYTFLSLELNNKKIFIDHIDRNPSNNNLENLRLATPNQNAKNNTAKGYTIRNSKYRVRIRHNYELINLGTFDSKEEAIQVYLDAKQKYQHF